MYNKFRFLLSPFPTSQLNPQVSEVLVILSKTEKWSSLVLIKNKILLSNFFLLLLESDNEALLYLKVEIN